MSCATQNARHDAIAATAAAGQRTATQSEARERQVRQAISTNPPRRGRTNKCALVPEEWQAVTARTIRPCPASSARARARDRSREFVQRSAALYRVARYRFER